MIGTERERNAVNCTEVQQRIWERASGLLSDDEWAAMERHLAECNECRRVADADSMLSKALASLPAAEVRVPTWAQVKAAHAPLRPKVRRWWIASSLASATAVAAMAWFIFAGQPRVVSPIMETAENNEASFGQAHLMLAASDPSADPNRAISFMYEAR
jgi:anti-sigma factor RsiW